MRGPSSRQRGRIALRDFVARLPQTLLACGALAVVGHVERAWGCSFFWPRAGGQTTVFESMFRRLMDGHPVGLALEYFNERFAELSVDLNTQLEDVRFGVPADDAGLERFPKRCECCVNQNPGISEDSGVLGPSMLSETALANAWTADNDARNYMLLGDPAVRLPASSNFA